MTKKLKKDERLGYLLKGAQQALRNKMDSILGESKLTTPQYSVLSALERIALPSNADLARECFVTAQTMIRIVKNLEVDGLIRKIDHPTHGKIIAIELTNKGRKLLQASNQHVNEIENMLLTGLSKQEQIIMANHLKQMIANLSHV